MTFSAVNINQLRRPRKKGLHFRTEHIIKYYKNYGILVAAEQNEQLWQCNEHTQCKKWAIAWEK